MARSKLHEYTGTHGVVRWDAVRCIHAAECVHTLPAVFDPAAKPWIRPEDTDAAVLAGAIERCPSGALSMRAPDGADTAAPPASNTGLVTAAGPIYVRGKITLHRGEERVTETRLALCRCGASQNKPYCDNSHLKVGFTDPGALPARSEAAPGIDIGAPLVVKPQDNGPVRCEGPLTLHGEGGRTAFAETTFLCRCGGSRNKPYCDGTHKAIGFVG